MKSHARGHQNLASTHTEISFPVQQCLEVRKPSLDSGLSYGLPSRAAGPEMRASAWSVQNCSLGYLWSLELSLSFNPQWPRAGCAGFLSYGDCCSVHQQHVSVWSMEGCDCLLLREAPWAPNSVDTNTFPRHSGDLTSHSSNPSPLPYYLESASVLSIIIQLWSLFTDLDTRPSLGK